jgi:hypothetical protein
MLDAVEVGADLGGQNIFGHGLFDHVLIQVGHQVLGFEIEVDGFSFLRRVVTESLSAAWGMTMGVASLTLPPNFLARKSPSSFSSSFGSGIFSLCSFMFNSVTVHLWNAIFISKTGVHRLGRLQTTIRPLLAGACRQTRGLIFLKRYLSLR